MRKRIAQAAPCPVTSAAGAAAILVLALAACGGSEAEGDEQASFEDAQVEFAECMRDNGVDVPDPEPGQGGFQFRAGPGQGGPDLGSEEFEAAREECRPILDEAIPEGERPDPAELQDQMLELAQCMRANGVDMPDPQVDSDGRVRIGPGPGGGGGGDSLRNDPDFEDAIETCRDEVGLRPPGGARFGGPGGGSSQGGG